MILLALSGRSPPHRYFKIIHAEQMGKLVTRLNRNMSLVDHLQYG